LKFVELFLKFFICVARERKLTGIKEGGGAVHTICDIIISYGVVVFESKHCWHRKFT